MTNRTAGYIISAVLLCAAIPSCSIFKKRISHDPAPVTIKVNKTEKPASPVYKKSEAEILADSLVAYAKTQIGVKYRYGGSSPSGFDCSGLVVFSFSHFGIFVPRTSSAQYSSSERISASEIRTGDLVFFNGSHAGETLTPSPAYYNTAGCEVYFTLFTGDTVKVTENGYGEKDAGTYQLNAEDDDWKEKIIQRAEEIKKLEEMDG